MKRVLMAVFKQEVGSFNPQPTCYDDFEIRRGTARIDDLRGTNTSTDEGRFTNRRVQYPISILGVQTFGDPERSTPGIHFTIGPMTSSDIFANDEYSFVAGHLLIKCFVNSLLVR